MLGSDFHYAVARQARANRWETITTNDIVLYIDGGATRIARIDQIFGVSEQAPEVANRVVACYGLATDFPIMSWADRVITTDGAGATRLVDMAHILHAAVWCCEGTGLAVIIPVSVRAAALC